MTGPGGGAGSGPGGGAGTGPNRNRLRGALGHFLATLAPVLAIAAGVALIALGLTT